MIGPKYRKKTECQKRCSRLDILLTELNILALDCQTTAANPNKGQLLEIGWITGCASSKSVNTDVSSYLIRLPKDEKIPAAVSRITGISAEDLQNSVSESDAWQYLMSSAEYVATENLLAACPTVIHFARFEIPFLERLYRTNTKGNNFPFRIICTHDIALRLLPELPRRGIRALAGYFGHSMPKLRRSANHAVATMSIWKSLVELLESRCEVNTLHELEQWLANTPPPGPTKRVFPMHPDVWSCLPNRPGIYRMRRTNRDILYIGKAKSLRQRVSSYFRSSAAHPEHILEMLTQARDLDYVPTDSALDAAVLESDEIKCHCPPYNVALRPEGRDLHYFTRDLLNSSIHCYDEYCIGPLPGSRSIDVLSAFAFWMNQHMRLEGHAFDVIGNALIGCSTDMRPDEACLQKGLCLFRSAHQDRLKHPSVLRVVTSLGAHIWRQQALKSTICESETEDNADAPLDEVATKEREWTPADIVRAIESLITHTAHMLRRARWFRLLLDSRLAWASSDDPNTLQHLLVFESGIVTDRKCMRPGCEMSKPRWRCKTRLKKHIKLDLSVYDRMRVVTTELRRLVCEGRTIELRPSPKIRLTSYELKKGLYWV